MPLAEFCSLFQFLNGPNSVTQQIAFLPKRLLRLASSSFVLGTLDWGALQTVRFPKHLPFSINSSLILRTGSSFYEQRFRVLNSEEGGRLSGNHRCLVVTT